MCRLDAIHAHRAVREHEVARDLMPSGLIRPTGPPVPVSTVTEEESCWEHLVILGTLGS